MRVEAQIKLWPSDRRFRLPATETPSMLYRFSEDDTMIGGRSTSASGTPFAPGTDHMVTIDFWAEDFARAMVREGGRFVIWYGEDIGEGVVNAVE